jgi:drug/metabolite transporter (DMT)-like permease
MTSGLTILYALLAAFCNALNVATQHVASTSDPRRSKGWRLVRYLLTSPLWLFGWVAVAGAFVFQALALNAGEMSVVQPLLVTELVFVLVLRRVWIHQTLRRITWWSAALTCVSLAIFVAMSEPQGGTTAPSGATWIAATLATVALAGVLAVLGMSGSRRRRAALLGSATAAMWALVATFIKTTTQTLSQVGVAGLFAHWPVYALALAAVGAEVLYQMALHVGPLSYSQPFLVIVDPIVSIALSVWVFEETFTADTLRVALAAVAFAAMCASVAVLTQTAPATMTADPAPGESP